MRVLLVEDDEHKAARLRSLLEASEGLVLDEAHSVQAALQLLEVTTPDLIVLDMSLPVFDYSETEDGFEHLQFGGKDILDFSERMTRRPKVVVLTARERFGDEDEAMTVEELDRELRRDYDGVFIETISYASGETAWEAALARAIAAIRAKE